MMQVMRAEPSEARRRRGGVAVRALLGALLGALLVTALGAGAAQGAPSGSPRAVAPGPGGSATLASERGPVVFADADTEKFVPCEGLPGCVMHVDRGDPSKGAAEETFLFRAGTRFAPHYHTSPEHVVGVAGVMQWSVGTKTYYVGPGDYLFYPSRAVHYGRCLPGADCTYHVYDSAAYDIHPARKP